MALRERLLAAAPLLLVLGAMAPGSGTSAELHANQLGFGLQDAKTVILADAAATPAPWQLTDARGRRVLAGRARWFGADAQSGDVVQQIDLSALHTPGRYTLAAGSAAPGTITIAPGLLRPLKYAALNYFYQTRAGIPIEARYAGGVTWARPAGHPHEIATCFSGTDQRGNRWPGCGYSLDVTGG
jgi:endoglucanase